MIGDTTLDMPYGTTGLRFKAESLERLQLPLHSVCPLLDSESTAGSSGASSRIRSVSLVSLASSLATTNSSHQRVIPPNSPSYSPGPSWRHPPPHTPPPVSPSLKGSWQRRKTAEQFISQKGSCARRASFDNLLPDSVDNTTVRKNSEKDTLNRSPNFQALPLSMNCVACAVPEVCEPQDCFLEWQNVSWAVPIDSKQIEGNIIGCASGAQVGVAKQTEGEKTLLNCQQEMTEWMDITMTPKMEQSDTSSSPFKYVKHLLGLGSSPKSPSSIRKNSIIPPSDHVIVEIPPSEHSESVCDSSNSTTISRWVSAIQKMVAPTAKIDFPECLVRLILRQNNVAAAVPARVSLKNLRGDAFLILENLQSKCRRALLLNPTSKPSTAVSTVLDLLQGAMPMDRQTQAILDSLLANKLYFAAVAVRNSERKCLVFIFESQKKLDNFFNVVILLQQHCVSHSAV